MAKNHSANMQDLWDHQSSQVSLSGLYENLVTCPHIENYHAFSDEVAFTADEVYFSEKSEID